MSTPKLYTQTGAAAAIGCSRMSISRRRQALADRGEPLTVENGCLARIVGSATPKITEKGLERLAAFVRGKTGPKPKTQNDAPPAESVDASESLQQIGPTPSAD